jgi:hypothetical protein
LSDGDDRGRGENNGSVGTKTDISERKTLQARNLYGPTNEYSSVNKNAISDGDDKGRGENNGNVGTKTDIGERTGLQAKNKYGNNKPYPDF